MSIAALAISALLGLWGVYRDVNQVDTVPSPEDQRIQGGPGDSIPVEGTNTMLKEPKPAHKSEPVSGANSGSASVVPPSAPSE